MCVTVTCAQCQHTATFSHDNHSVCNRRCSTQRAQRALRETPSGASTRTPPSGLQWGSGSCYARTAAVLIDEQSAMSQREAALTACRERIAATRKGLGLFWEKPGHPERNRLAMELVGLNKELDRLEAEPIVTPAACSAAGVAMATTWRAGTLEVEVLPDAHAVVTSTFSRAIPPSSGTLPEPVITGPVQL